MSRTGPGHEQFWTVLIMAGPNYAIMVRFDSKKRRYCLIMDRFDGNRSKLKECGPFMGLMVQVDFDSRSVLTRW